MSNTTNFTLKIKNRRNVRKYIFRCVLMLFVVFIITRLIQEFRYCREKMVGDHIVITDRFSSAEISSFAIKRGIFWLETPFYLKKQLILEDSQLFTPRYRIQANIVEKKSIFASFSSGENTENVTKINDGDSTQYNSIRNIKSVKRPSKGLSKLIESSACRFSLIVGRIEQDDNGLSSGNWIKEQFFLWLSTIKEFLLKSLQSNLSPMHALFMNGIIFGGQDELPDDLQDKFKLIGLTHILVASGYNVMIVTVTTYGLVQFIANYRQRRVVVLVVIWIYALIAGLTAPIIRASLMMSLILISQLGGRPTWTMWTLIFSGMLMIVIYPLWLFELSFQLSFLATVGMVSVAQHLNVVVPKFGNERWPQLVNVLIENVRENFLTTISALLLTGPLIIYHFEQFSVISLIANLILLLFIPILTVLGMLLIVAWIIHPFLSSALGVAINALLLLFFQFVELFSLPSWATVPIRINGWGVIIFYTVMFVVVYWISFAKPKKNRASDSEFKENLFIN